MTQLPNPRSRPVTDHHSAQLWPIFSAICTIALLLVGLAERMTAAETSSEVTTEPSDAKAALARFNSLIGGWRGIGMPKRNSRRGAWQETAEWVWHFEQGSTSLHYNIKNGKLLASAVLSWDAETAVYQLSARFPDDLQRDYSGKLAENKLVLDSEPDEAGYVHRITLTRLNPKRTIVLLQKRRENSGFFSRVAEIGYTRKGTKLATAGSSDPVCVVTGGKGTMTVSYKGQTYYVCCSGCRQAFDDDPEGIIAEYKQRVAAAKAKKAKLP